MNKSVLAAAAALAIAGGAMTIPASAADLDFLPPPPMPAPLAPTWQGFYFGGHVGYGEATFKGRADFDFIHESDPDEDVFASFRRTLTPDGLLGGVQAGYNWQADSLVFGIEGDISITDWSHRSTVFDELLDPLGIPGGSALGVASADVDFLASVRGRVGFAFDSLLIYGTGGVAWADAEARGRLIVDDGFDVTVHSRKKSFSDVGWVVGGGLAWMVIPQTFSLGVEGLFYFFDEKKTLFFDEIAVPDGVVDSRVTAELEDAWVVRLRGDIHF